MASASSTQTSTLHLITKNQNLFDNTSPSRTTIIIHACNTQGVWGAGVALEMKRRFPQAYGAYRAFCLEEKAKREERKGKVRQIGKRSRVGDKGEGGEDGNEDQLVGKCMLTFVPPPPLPASTSNPGTTTNTRTPSKLIIANLFTRSMYGPLTPQELSHTNTYTSSLLSATSQSLTALLSGLVDLHTQGILSKDDLQNMELRMPKINSGRFMVEWDLTRRVVEGIIIPRELRDRGWNGEVVVCCLD